MVQCSCLVPSRSRSLFGLAFVAWRFCRGGRTSGEAPKLLQPQAPRGFSALAFLYYLAHPTKTALLRRLFLGANTEGEKKLTCAWRRPRARVLFIQQKFRFDFRKFHVLNVRALKQSEWVFFRRASLFVAPYWRATRMAKQLSTATTPLCFGFFRYRVDVLQS